MSNARELFNQLNTDRRELRRIRLTIETLRNDSGYHSMDYSQERVQTSPNGATPAEKIVARIMELETKEKGVHDSYMIHLAKAERIASMLGGIQGDYIVRRYVCDQKTEDIAKELHYTRQYLYNVGVEAFREIDRRKLCD